MRKEHRDVAFLVAALLVGAAVLYLSSVWGLEPHGRCLLATFSTMVIVWGTGCMSLPVSCLLLLVLMTFSLSGPGGSGGLDMGAALRLSLQGFAGLVPITIVAGTAFAAVVRSSGLAERIVFCIMKLAGRRSGGATPGGILAAFFMADSFASIMIPSAIGRCAMYLAIVEGFEKPLKFGKVDGPYPVNPFQKAVWISVSLVTLIMGGAFLTGASLTIMVGGMIEQGTGVPQFWMTSFALLYPPALAVMAVSWFLLLRLFPSTVERIDSTFVNDELKRMGTLTYKEKYCLAVFVVMVLLFLTDTIHKVPPPMVLVAASLALFLPGIGPGDWKVEGKHIGWDGFFIIGVALGFSNVLMQYGVMKFIAAKISLVSIPSFPVALLLMVGATLLIRLGVASITASAALIVPVTAAVGKAAGLDTFQIVSLCWVAYIFCRMSFFLPHQSVEVLMSYGYGGYTKNDLAKAAFCIIPSAFAIYFVWGVFCMPGILQLLS